MTRDSGSEKIWKPPESVSTTCAACVVAPELDAPRLLAALRERIDPVFLPRPLLFLESLPRNGTGKLPRTALHALFSPRVATGPEPVDE